MKRFFHEKNYHAYFKLQRAGWEHIGLRNNTINVCCNVKLYDNPHRTEIPMLVFTRWTNNE